MKSGITSDKHGEVRSAYEILFGIHYVKGPVENLRHRLEDDIKMVLRELGDVQWI